MSTASPRFPDFEAADDERARLRRADIWARVELHTDGWAVVIYEPKHEVVSVSVRRAA